MRENPRLIIMAGGADLRRGPSTCRPLGSRDIAHCIRPSRLPLALPQTGMLHSREGRLQSPVCGHEAESSSASLRRSPGGNGRLQNIDYWDHPGAIFRLPDPAGPIVPPSSRSLDNPSPRSLSPSPSFSLPHPADGPRIRLKFLLQKDTSAN